MTTMTTPQLRSQVLGLYRQFLRLGRRWQATNEHETATERAYIRDETRRLFRENAHVASRDKIAEHVREAEARLTMAEHYRNPYPRPVNLPPRSYAQKEGKKAGKAIERLNRMSKPVYMASIDDTATNKVEENKDKT